MTEIKICGLTRLADARWAAENGADALGFIFFEASPRCVQPAEVRAMVAALPPETVTVGVFVNRDPLAVHAIVDYCGLDLIQLHGDESPAECRSFAPERVIKAVRPRRAADIETLDAYAFRAVLLDTWRPGHYGGTGRPADWDAARALGGRYPLILAGGLGPESVVAALETVKPRAVDVNSGVESHPGCKDPGRVRALIAAVRGWDKEPATRPASVFGRDLAPKAETGPRAFHVPPDPRHPGPDKA